MNKIKLMFVLLASLVLGACTCDDCDNSNKDDSNSSQKAYTETTVTVDGTEYTEIDKRRFSSVFTASELAFYQGNQKVAYLANDKLYVTDATFTGSVSLGDAWEISHARGFTVKWIGG